ncbi:MAG: glycosyltransferase [Bacteroidales bacterium]|nr:glycosyltransferase [Bacteroidales bacterium]
MFFSIITPIYQCSKETEEFLTSLVLQKYDKFEIILIEDGSKDSSKEVISRFRNKLNIKYYFIENTSVSYRRNYGMSVAQGDYFVFFDSDCIIPENYFKIVSKEILENDIKVWGGPDKDHDSFSNLQKAINYSMTSIFTTGGIRGGKKKVGKYHPRSFNMGIGKEVFETTGGFPTVVSPGEDIIFSINIQRNGYLAHLIYDAFVYHKRKISIKKYFRQISSFGFVRYPISLLYPETFSPIFLMPSVYILGILFLLLMSAFVHLGFILPLVLHYFMIFIDARIKTKKNYIAALSIVTSFIQFSAYGSGFVKSVVTRFFIGKKDFFNKYGYSKL